MDLRETINVKNLNNLEDKFDSIPFFSENKSFEDRSGLRPKLTSLSVQKPKTKINLIHDESFEDFPGISALSSVMQASDNTRPMKSLIRSTPKSKHVKYSRSKSYNNQTSIYDTVINHVEKGYVMANVILM